MTAPTTLDSFESALLTELRQHVADRPAQVRLPAASPSPNRRRRVRRIAVGAVAAGLAASVVGVVSIGGHGGASPAYAVELDGDGDVVVTVRRLDDAAGLEAALKDKGIDADVSYDADGTDTIGVSPDGEMLAEDDLPSLPPGATTQQHGPVAGGSNEKGPVTDAQQAEAGVPANDPCGFDVDAPPADLSQKGDDWVLRIPAGSPLMDRHVEIGTDAQGGLAVFYAGDEPGSFCGVAHTASPK